MTRRIKANRAEFLAAAAATVVLLAALDLPNPVKFIALALAIALVIAGGPISALCLVVAALSVSALTIQVGSTEWSPLELSLLGAGLATGFAVLIDLRRGGLRRIWGWVGAWDVVLLGAALLVVAGASLMWVADPDIRTDSLRAFRRVIVEPLLVVPGMAYVTRSRTESTVVRWLVWPSTAVALLSVLQVVLQQSVVSIGGVSRPIGTFTHPNNLAFYLERVIWFGPLIAIPLARTYGRVAWLLVGLVTAAVLLTLSRGAAVALTIGGLVMFWEFVRARLRLVVALALTGAAAVFASRYLAGTGDSIDSRTTIWRAAIDMIRDHPVTGVGLDQFLGQYGRRYVRPEGWSERYTSHPHNLVLDFWLSLGIAGLVWLWLLLEVVWRRIAVALRSPAWSVQRAGSALLVAGLAHGLIDNSFFLPYLATLTWIGLTIGGPPGRMVTYE